MKKLILVIALFSGSAIADECKVIQDAAISVMHVRQMGEDKERMINLAGDEKILIDMLEDAYSVPDWNSESLSEKAKSDFEEKWTLRCYRGNT